MKSLVLAGVLLAGLFSTSSVGATVFECEASPCAGQIITPGGAVVFVDVPLGGFIRVSDSHTFVTTSGKWKIRQS